MLYIEKSITHSKLTHSITLPKIFRNEFSKYRNQKKTRKVHNQTAIILHPREGLAP